MKTIINALKITVFFLFVTFLVQCSDDTDNVPYVRPETAKESTHPNDVFLKKHMLTSYGTAVRWRWDDRFIKPTQKAVPIASKFVIPVTELVEYLWIGAYESQGKAGKKFIQELFPPELQYIGSYIYQKDGSMLLGYAEGGARITLLNLNSYDLTDRDWMTSPGGGVLATVHHEFSHIVHQNYGLPQGFKGITDYVGNGWLNINQEEALKLGAVRNYGALNEFEDFCEIISHFLVLPKDIFEEEFLIQEDCSELTDPNEVRNCQELNAGREKIAIKLNLIIKFYKDKFNLDLVAMRDELQKRIDYVVENNKIPNK